MTEMEWLAATDPMTMLEFVRGQFSKRRLLMLGIAIARASWDRLEDERTRRAVDAAERYADGMADASALEGIVNDAFDVRDEMWDAGPADCDDRLWLAEAAAITASITTTRTWRNAYERPVSTLANYPFRIPSATHCTFLRDIFGNPFRPVTLDPTWLTPTVVTLANSIYSERAFDRMPILADALEEAGCDNADVLLHCRGDGPHVKGCWVVDLVLGKE